MVLVLALASVGMAFQNEPDGFRGLKWGDPPGEDMEFSRTAEEITFYTRSGEKLQIGDVSLDSVSYSFIEGRFILAGVKFSGKENYKSLATILETRYGEPTEKGVFDKLSWYGGKVMIYLFYDRIEKGNLALTDAAGMLEYIERKRKAAAEKAADDF